MSNMLKSIIAILFGLSLLTACGGGNSEAEKEPETNTETMATESNEATLSIAGNDQMQFDKKELTVKAGQKVTLTLKHTGTMAKAAMGHNWVLLTPGTDIATFAEKAVAAGEANDYIPSEGNAIIAHTKLVGGGESTTVEFTAPAAGSYEFICSFPGHWAMMRGTLIVE
ncbi:MAG: azurin [Ignavibacteriae bacterium HGW-Ignavibacteriae-4]|nr:MAG: azurin [Ignavibacteriae bacterium HGW-Ignavibacteriae-4]